MAYNPIIFDLDGTLLNTLGDLADASNYALEKLGYPTHPEEKYRMFVGNGIPKLMERILPEGSSKEEQKRLHDIFAEYYESHKADRTAPYPQITELLCELRSLGITAVCNTNKSHNFSVALLDKFFGDKLCEVCGDSGKFPRKPSPDAAVYLAEKYKSENCKPLFVGDSGVDMQTAINSGIDACGVLWGFRTKEELSQYSPKFLAEDVSQLRDFILNG